jgi:hypothetical protein
MEYLSNPLLEGDRLNSEQLLAQLAALGVSAPALLDLADVVLVARTNVRTVRSCALAGYEQVLVEETCIVALAIGEAGQAGGRRVRVAQVSPAAAYAALLDLNRRRLKQHLALARLRRRLGQYPRQAHHRRSLSRSTRQHHRRS